MSDETNIQPAVTPAPDRVYAKPQIEHELDLETRAGTPLGVNPISDPLGLNSANQPR